MKFSRKIFFITFLIIIISFGAGGFFLINTVFSSMLNDRVNTAANVNRYVTTTLSVYVENISSTSDSREYIRTSATEFAKQIAAGIPDTKVNIGNKNKMSFNDDNSFVNDLQNNTRGYSIEHQNGKYYLQTVCKTTLGLQSYYIETITEITDIYNARDTYCSMYQIVVVGVGLLASVLLLLFSRFLTKPLTKLTAASKQIASGNFNMRVEAGKGLFSSAEVIELSQNFNTMAEYVEDYIEELKQAAQNRDNFVADFTHELKTPLTSVIGYADMLRSYEMEPEQRRECAELIYKEGSRLEALSLNLLELIVLKNNDIKTAPANASAIADETQKAVHFLLKRYNVTLELDVADAEIMVESSLIKTLLYNLIDNACKASAAESTVTLSGKISDGRYSFCVADNGCGIPEDQLNKITEPFYMVDKSRARSMGGAGLGLSICNEIAILHGSVLNIESTVGKGTTIGFSVPLADITESEGAENEA